MDARERAYGRVPRLTRATKFQARMESPGGAKPLPMDHAGFSADNCQDPAPSCFKARSIARFVASSIFSVRALR
jgi:hypothetical protein